MQICQKFMLNNLCWICNSPLVSQEEAIDPQDFWLPFTPNVNFLVLDTSDCWSKLLSVLYQVKNSLGFRKTIDRTPLGMLATPGEVLSTSSEFT